MTLFNRDKSKDCGYSNGVKCGWRCEKHAESIEGKYCRLREGYNDLTLRKRKVDEKLDEFQKEVAHFIGIATAIGVLRTTPKLEDAYLRLCDAYKRSHE